MTGSVRANEKDARSHQAASVFFSTCPLKDKAWDEMVHPERFERPTPRFVVWCSIQLSYGCILRG